MDTADSGGSRSARAPPEPGALPVLIREPLAFECHRDLCAGTAEHALVDHGVVTSSLITKEQAH